MPKLSRNDEPIATTEGIIAKLPGPTVVAVIAGIAAAWIAAGSTGFWGHCLRHALTCLALGIAVIAAWPWPNRTWKNWAILATGVAGSLVLNSSILPTVNVLGVVLLLATLAYIHEGQTSRAILLAALAAMTLAVFQLALTASPMVWQLAGILGWGMGKLAGYLTGRPLNIGATFGGIDFLVLMVALYTGWLCNIAPPRRRACIYAGAAILIVHLAYLIILAYSEKIAALLPEPFYVPETDISRVGAWAWQNAVRTFLPWNLPVLAMILQCIIAVCMFRWADWLPVAKPDNQKSLSKSGYDEIIEFRTLIKDASYKFGPVVLAVLIGLLTSLSPDKSDLKGKTFVAYDKGNFNWLKPEYDNPIEGGYGMLPVFIDSLGGSFVKSPELVQNDLESADVLILLHPNSPFTAEQLKRIENFVRQGGALLLGAENYIRVGLSESHFNDVLKPTGMEVRYDTAIPLSTDWEQSYQAISHPAALGLDDKNNRFGFQRGSSIRLGWSARPVVVGRWGWSTPGSDVVKQKSPAYQEGLPLGDIVLAAEEPLGQGRIVVLGDVACLSNERLSCSYEFAGRLLGYLAHRSSNPQDLWRQFLSIAAMISLVWLLIERAEAMLVAVTSMVFAAALILCIFYSDSASPVLPDGRGQVPNKLAYIDTSHLEAFSGNLWDDYGIAGFTRVLMRSGFLPLRLNELTAERLDRAGLLVCMAPARRFSAEEIATLHQFVEQGGTFLCLVGAEEARPSAALLEEFQFKVHPSPIRPDEEIREPEPLGSFRQSYSDSGGSKHYVNTYASWPLELDNGNAKVYLYWTEADREEPAIAGIPFGGGVVAVIADTNFAVNRNLESVANEFPDNIVFWRWFFPMITRMEAWNPPAEPLQEKGIMEKDDAIPEQGPQ
ncbi:MAG: DUF4350 domain-containing protein [Thermoguttaceae bacterium]